MAGLRHNTGCPALRTPAASDLTPTTPILTTDVFVDVSTTTSVITLNPAATTPVGGAQLVDQRARHAGPLGAAPLRRRSCHRNTCVFQGHSEAFQLRTRIGPPLVTWNGVLKFLATQHLKQLEAFSTRTLARCDLLGNLGSSSKFLRESKAFLIVCHVLMRVRGLKSHVGLSVNFLQDSGNSIGPRSLCHACNHPVSAILLQISQAERRFRYYGMILASGWRDT